MSRNGIWKSVALVCSLVLLLASACAGEAKPTGTPSATLAPGASGALDLKPILRNFLSNMPDAWGLALSQSVARTKPFVVDVRQPEEYNRGFIEGAVNIPLRELVRSLPALPAMDKELVLVDSAGHRSAIGMVALQLLGYKKARSLHGGMQAWQAARLAVVTQPVPQRPSGAPPKVDADLQAALDHYLTFVLPDDWGSVSPPALALDQARKSSIELEIQPETYDQGPSILVDVDEPDEFAKATLPKAINIPFRELPDNLGKMPTPKVTLWA